MAAHSTACAAGWVHASRPDRRPPREFLKDSYAELSADGIGLYDVVVVKLAAMHAREPGLTGADLREITPRTLVMVGDDDEVRLEHAIEMYRVCRRRTRRRSRYLAWLASGEARPLQL